MTRAVSAHIVSAFIDERGGGNLAGVVLDEPELTEAQMQRVASDLALSETAFVRAVEDGFQADFFTPNKRVADCGHATVAAFGLLAQRGIVSGETTKFTVNDPRAIRIEDGDVFMQQPAPRYEVIADYESILASLGIDESPLVTLPTLARHDVGFIIVALSSATALSAIAPDMAKIKAISEAHDVIGFYVTAPGSGEFDKTIRMFAPSYGIPEESATGMAAGLLAGYLYDCAGIVRDMYVFEQGAFMTPPSPSKINARLVTAKDKILEIWVGGHAKVLEQRELSVLF